MNKIVFEHYPASRLPNDMRAKVEPASIVTVEVTIEDLPSGEQPTLEEIFARRQPPFRTIQEIDNDLRRDRDAWND